MSGYTARAINIWPSHDSCQIQRPQPGRPLDDDADAIGISVAEGDIVDLFAESDEDRFIDIHGFFADLGFIEPGARGDRGRLDGGSGGDDSGFDAVAFGIAELGADLDDLLFELFESRGDCGQEGRAGAGAGEVVVEVIDQKLELLVKILSANLAVLVPQEL